MSLDTSGKCSRCGVVVPPDVQHTCSGSVQALNAPFPGHGWSPPTASNVGEEEEIGVLRARLAAVEQESKRRLGLIGAAIKQTDHQRQRAESAEAGKALLVEMLELVDVFLAEGTITVLIRERMENLRAAVRAWKESPKAAAHGEEG